MSDGLRTNAIVGHVEGARPYGVGGNMPPDAVVMGQRPHGAGRQYVSDAPYESWEPPVEDVVDEPPRLVVKYDDWPYCSSLRTDGKPCKAKVRPGEERCSAHPLT